MAAPSGTSRWGRRLLIAVAAIVLLAGGGYLALALGFPPERIAALASEQVSARTGRDFRIEGKLAWRVLPRVAIVADGLVLGNAPWGSRKEMLRVEHAALDLELWPLLQGEVRVGSVELEGVDLLLETNRDGGGNWVLAPQPQAAPEPGAPGAAARTIALETLRMRDVKVTYRDRGATHVLDLSKLDLDRADAGNRVGAEWTLRDQRWRADGRLGTLDALVANAADWPFDIQAQTEGARIAAQGRLLHGAPPRAARIELDARVDKPVALAPWTDNAARVALPAEMKATLAAASDAVKADPLSISLAGQTVAGRATWRGGEPWQLDASLKGGSIDLASVLPKRTAGGAGPGAQGADPTALFGDARLPFDELPKAVAKIDLRVDASGVSAEELAHVAGNRKVGGGKVQLVTSLAMRGNTPRALAASANGDLLVRVDDMTLAAGATLPGAGLLPRLLQIAQPRRDAAQATTVQCAVARLPFRNGVAAVDRTIAAETSDLTFSATGKIDLRDQTLELAFRPGARAASKPVQLASLVIAKGPLLDPKLAIDARGAAGLALSIGAAAASGGWSAIGKNLLQPASDPHPCVFAATGVAAKVPAAAAAPASKDGARPAQTQPDDVRKLLRNLFK